MNRLINFFTMQCIIAARSKTALLWSFLYPFVMLILMLSVFGGMNGDAVAGDDPRLMTVAGVLVITVMSGGIFAITTVLSADFQNGVYKRLRVTDLTRFHVIGGLILRQFMIILLGAFLVCLGANLIFSVPLQGDLLTILLLLALGSVLCCSIGFIIANVCHRPQTATAVANGIFLIMLFLSGSTFPKTFFPEWLNIISHSIPASYLYDLLESQLFYNERLADNTHTLFVLLAMCFVSLALAIKTFKWE